jgi:DNA polymerase III subunit alpha
MGSGMLDDFVNRKHGKSPIVYDHPILEPVLKDTYGVILYQEQVMRIAIDLAGFTPAQSDNLRKAMGKKIPEILEKEKSNFVNGALAKDVKKEIAEKVFDNIIKFGGYGFNKSHSTAYGFVSYRTAYLKANFPVEYMTALLNSASGDSDSVMNYISECSDMNIEVLPVNIQKSFEKFSIEDLENNKIRLGFSVVKGVGEGSAEAIVKARENNDFKSLTDMLRRVEPNSLNKKVVENLAKAGAFDCLNYKRASVFEGFESIVASVNRSNKDLNSGQISFFDQIEDLGENTEELPDVSEWHESILLSYEKEVLGFYMTGHPLVNLKKEIKAFSSTCIKDILDKKSRTEIKIVGFVNNIKKLKTKKGDLMCFMNFEDLTGETEVLVFPKTYSQYSQNFDKDQIVFLKAKVDAKEEKVNLIAEEILEFSEAKKVYVKELIINIEQVFLDEENMEKLKSILTDEINSEDAFIRVILNVKSTNHGFVKIDTKKNINLNEKLENDLKDIFGKNCISYRIK